MRLRALAVAAFFALFSLPGFAAFRQGDVLVEDQVFNPYAPAPGYEFWEFDDRSGVNYAVASGATLLIYDFVPLGGPGHFLVPSTGLAVFHYDRTVAWWNGESTSAFDSDKGYIDIFRDDADLSEIAPLRGGRFLVAERSADPARGAKLIEFNLKGVIAEHPFPANVAGGMAIGAAHIEVLSDQCTVLYTTGDMDPAGSRVRRMSICTNEAMSDFASLLPGQYAGAIRRLPNGDVLVANGVQISRFDTGGALIGAYPFEGVTHIVLSSDGKSFYAAGVDMDRADFRHYDAGAQSIVLGNPGMSTATVPQRIDDIVTVGEWRAATAAAPRFRAVRY